MPPSTALVGLVLGGVDYGDADRIVHLLTAEHGRVDGLARGLRRSKRRFGGGLEAGCRVRLMARPGRGELWHLDSSELEEGRAHLRGDLGRLALALYAVEWVGGLARAEHPEPRLFGLLDVALTVLDGIEAAPGPLFRLGLELKALTFAGLAPRLGACAVCGEALAEPAPAGEGLCWAVGAGGVVHRRCGGGEPVDLAYVGALEHARRTPLLELVDTPCPPGPRWIIAEHLAWHTGRELRSRKVLGGLELG